MVSVRESSVAVYHKDRPPVVVLVFAGGAVSHWREGGHAWGNVAGPHPPQSQHFICRGSNEVSACCMYVTAALSSADARCGQVNERQRAGGRGKGLVLTLHNIQAALCRC